MHQTGAWSLRKSVSTPIGTKSMKSQSVVRVEPQTSDMENEVQGNSNLNHSTKFQQSEKTPQKTPNFKRVSFSLKKNNSPSQTSTDNLSEGTDPQLSSNISTENNKFSFTVYCTSTQKNYKILIKHKDVSKLKVSKIKSNLFRVVNIPVEEQALYASRDVLPVKPLDDTMTGRMLDLNENTVLFLVHVSQMEFFEKQVTAKIEAQMEKPMSQRESSRATSPTSIENEALLQRSPQMQFDVQPPQELEVHQNELIKESPTVSTSSNLPPNNNLSNASEKLPIDTSNISSTNVIQDSAFENAVKHLKNQFLEEKMQLARKFAIEKKEILQKANEDRQELMTENTRLRKELLQVANVSTTNPSSRNLVTSIQQEEILRLQTTLSENQQILIEKDKIISKLETEISTLKKTAETESQFWKNRLELEKQVSWNREKEMILKNWAEEIEILKLSQQQERIEAQNVIDQVETELQVANNKIECDRKFVESADLALETLKNQIAKLTRGDYDTATLMMEAAKEKALIEKKFNDLLISYTSLRDLMDEEVKKRKQLHNLVEDMKGNIRVIVRLRPLLEDEQPTDLMQGRLEIKDDNTITVATQNFGSKNHEFYKVLDENANQEDVFEHVKPLIQSALDGYNLCIFAYGQTGSGKTFTIHGDKTQHGLIQRAAEFLYNTLEKQTGARRETFSISCSMVELYLDNLYDLFDESISGIEPQHRFTHVISTQKKKPQLRQSKNGKMSVTNCTEIIAHTPKDLLDLIDAGNEAKQVYKTEMNDHSSRSHTIFTIKLIIEGSTQPNSLNPNGKHYRKESKIAFVDLAGSERVSKSNSTGERFKEAQHINKSLSSLGDVIAALSVHQKHVPYRNSKLTLMLQEMIGGNSKTLMFANISPDRKSISETISTLSFASRVKCVQNHPILSRQVVTAISNNEETSSTTTEL
ncbi:hypothetical protein C9374_012534 [Naegleria lovaniensis]|uniref:Kinesin-like protein n=1 Tax=Naegleria lovaniensis TaxID=51637 RepID=A0AA88H359_NAELO|nr:uncharacterized protein C9374_012534 [Naegleria lovaniensis]KAG2392282.1 hypothetical protein C9374_012534 [Naegleria lovaniensis]